MIERIGAILREQEILNEHGNFSTISKETGVLLYALVKIKNPKAVLEIGTSIGYSSVWIASAFKKGSKLICIDRWPERCHIAKQFFKKSRLPITLMEGDALKIIPQLKQKFDAVFLDATKSEYLRYLKLLINHNKLNRNAMIVADNTISHADKMRDFLEFAKKRKAMTLSTGKGITIFSV